MKLFNTIALEINARCNRKCAFCPVAYNQRPSQRMSSSLFLKALLELKDLKYHGRVELYIYNEPCMEMPYLLDCIRQARSHAPRACIMIATNGDYLRGPHNILALYQAGLNQLLVNCYSAGLFERRAEWLQGLAPEIEVDNHVYANTGPRRRLFSMLDKSDTSNFGTGLFKLANRAGNIVPFLPAAPAPLKRMCTKPFRFLNINWRGQALICCQDYHGTLTYGNIESSTLVQLWNHPVMNTYRKHLYKRDRTLPMCRLCDCAAGAYPNNVPAPSGPV